MAPTSRHQPLFIADDKFPDVIAQLQTRGWKRFPHESFPKFDLKWSNYATIAWPRVSSAQIVNHFHNAVVLSRKDALAARLYNSNATTSSSPVCGEHDDVKTVDAFYPRTLDLHMEGAREKLAVWFLYGRAVAILLEATQPTIQRTPDTLQQEHTHATLTAMRFLTNVLEMDGFFTLWSQNLDLSPLDAWSDRWKPLHSHHDADNYDHHHHLRECIDATQIEAMLTRLRSLDPQLDCIHAGRGDVWICKPSNLSQGRGIHLVSDWDTLLRVGSQDDEETYQADDGEAAKRGGTWIVQKYVERPLLLQNQKLKFDVRQWVLLTSLEPLTIYWYTSSYLRFCSQPFSLDDATLGDSFTHLSNYSIQKHAPSTSAAAGGEGRGAASDAECEDAKPPPQSVDSMWHSRQLQELLRQTHGRDVWHETIVPQMQHATQRAIQAALPEMSQVGRGFEWLGIDFLIDASLHVWLLEVNVSPDVSHSTAVTAQLVPEATRGVLDLVLGLDPSSPSDPAASLWVKMSLRDA